MQLNSNAVLITGGATGIGLALAERFLRAGSDVVICGRRLEKLREAKARHPQLGIRICDLTVELERVSLFDWAVSELPRLNVLINNAGIQRRVRLAEPEEWECRREEIAVNLEAPVHLSTLFIPHLLKQERPAILNVTSGLGFVPMASAPIYSATKAALHSFTLSLRRQLEGTPIRVVEIVPPAVNTDLGGAGLHTFGTPVDEFVDAVLSRIAGGESEVAYGFSEQTIHGSRADLDQIFKRMNQ